MFKLVNLLLWLLCITLLIQSYVVAQPVNSNPELKSERDERNPDNSYSFSYETVDGQIREETGTFEEVNGEKILVVKGKYSYVAPDGYTYQVIYIADQNGYRAEGDHLPVKKSIRSSMKTAGGIMLAKRINPSLVASLTGG